MFLLARDIRAEAERYWDRIALTEEENIVVEALGIVGGDRQDIEGIAFASPRLSDGEKSHAERFPMAKIKAQRRPNPLSNLGEGMNRAFALAIGLIQSENGALSSM